MNKIRMTLIILVSQCLLACSGGGSGGGSATPKDGDQQNIQDLAYELAEGETSLSSNYEIPEGDSVIAHTSSDGLSEYTSAFTLSQGTSINQISFSGVALGELEEDLVVATFVVTVYEPSDINPAIPDSTKATELILQAQAKSIADIASDQTLYSFNINQANLFTLDTGSYFISIMDLGSEGFEFQWARENSNNLSTGLAGGASKADPQGEWQADSWGRNLRLAGSCQSLCTIEGETKGSIGITSSSYQAEAAVLDDQSTDPVYFMGVYEGDASAQISVDITAQESHNVTLVLSAYNATTWTLTGAGLGSVTNVYVLGYQQGTVTGLPNSIAANSYSFDENNYIGTLSEWPDPVSEEYPEPQRRESLLGIEALTGSVTSYSVVYSTDGFVVY